MRVSPAERRRVGKRLFRLRYEAGLSQEQLSERSGVSRAKISRLETGAEGAYPETWERLAAELETTRRYLLTGSYTNRTQTNTNK